MRTLLILLTCLVWPLAALAQSGDDEDRGFIAGLLESALGGEGRTVRIIGFAGALSSTATIEQITIADGAGIWLTVDDVVMTWRRAALLRGVIDIEELSASRIAFPRLPATDPGIVVPDAEATPFALPDLPASVQLGQLDIDAVILGAPVLGEAAALTLSGGATLANGTGDAKLVAQRTDGRPSTISLDAAFANDTRTLDLDLNVSEGANGLLSGVLDLPGRPSLDLKVVAAGALSDLTASLDLRTDDAPRLAGTLALQSEEDGPLGFDVDLGGDVTALFLPQYAAFFGPDISLNAQGNQDGTGALRLDQFALDARAVSLRGQAALNSDGWPTLLDIEGQIADPDGGAVLLPGQRGDETRLDVADLAVTYDASDSDALSAQISVAGLDRVDLQADQLTLGVDGTLDGAVNAIGTLAARIDLAASGLSFADPALAQAIGTVLRGGLDVAYADNAPVKLSNLSLTGAAWAANGDVTIQSLSEDFATAFNITLDTPDLSAFAALAGLALDGAGQITAQGSAALGGFFDVAIAGTTRDLAIGIPQADAVLAGATQVDLTARRDETGTFLDRLTLTNPALSADVSAELQTGASDARFALQLDDAGRVLDTLNGPLTVEGTARQMGEVWDLSTTLAGPLNARAALNAQIAGEDIDIDLSAGLPDLQPLVPQVSGGAQIIATAQQRAGAWDFNTSIQGPFDSAATASGRYADNILNATYTGFLPSLDQIAPGIPGALTLSGGVQQVATGWEFTTALSGPYAAQIDLAGAYLSSVLSAHYTATLADVSPLAPGITGAARVEGSVRQVGDGWAFETDLSGPYASAGTVTGTYVDLLATNFQVALPDIAPLAPGISGPLGATGTLLQTAQGWTIEADVTGPYASTATLGGTYGAQGAAARYAFRMPNVGAVVSGISGAAEVTGTAAQVARGFDIDATLDGPAGTTARVEGLVGADSTLALDATGQAQLGLINPFIEPRNISGVAGFDLTIDGPAALSSVRGQISTQGVRLAAPNAPVSFSDISGTVDLAQGQARLDLNAQVSEGGTIGLSGPITLEGRYPAQLDVALNNVVVTDNVLYNSLVNGGVSLNGALTGGARVSGTIDVGETTVRVPASTVSTLGSIPDITHIGETRPQMRTRARAGLVAETGASGGASVAFPLDITINAPSRIFVRGRGIDAELGGGLRITGTSADTISTGQIDLIRGRINVLNKRFDLTEGRVELQGRFEPFLLLVAETSTATGTASIVVDGALDDPTVTFESNPEAPQDQVLAQVFFGRDISQLSAFQALQLASAVASLAGVGGEGIVSQLRGSFGLDDLDVSTDEDGNAAVRAGKYLSDNVYTDVTVGGTQGPEVSLNIDLTPNVTVRGSVAADSSTGVGVFLEKDY